MQKLYSGWKRTFFYFMCRMILLYDRAHREMTHRNLVKLLQEQLKLLTSTL